MVVPWANGLGTTAVVARHPDTDDWAWRLSIADVVADGPFSSLPGVSRWIAVVTGAGMVLTVDGTDTTLTPSSEAFASTAAQSPRAACSTARSTTST